MSEWKTIDSAPKDGTWVLVTGGEIEYRWDGDTQPKCVAAQYTNFLNMKYRDESWWQFAWYDGGYYGVYEAPTHWQPLPEPPQ